MSIAFDQDTITIATGTTNPNVLAGRLLDKAPFVCAARLLAAGSAAGLYVTITAGLDTICRQVAVNAQNRVPVEPDDVLTDFIIRKPGDGIGISVNNPTLGNIDFNFRLILTELEEVPM